MAGQYQHRQLLFGTSLRLIPAGLARQSAPGRLFRRAPNKLLARYFESRDLDLGVDFGNPTETQVDLIFETFTALPEEQQAGMEVDFQDIDALALTLTPGDPPLPTKIDPPLNSR